MTNVSRGHVQIEALADATRRAILEQLLDGPMAVGDLAKQFPVSRPAAGAGSSCGGALSG